jgi:uncharacterized protein (DUF885 family)
MREGAAKGVVQPRPVMEKVLSQLDSLIVSKAEQSLFYGPVAKFPDTVPVAERERLTVAYKAAIDGKVMPAYRRVRDYVRDDYLPKTRTTAAWTALPDGKAWYAYLVKEHTTTDMSPEQIHQLGLDEVARILGEMDGVRREVGFEGDLQAFFNHLESDPQFYFTQSADLCRAIATSRRASTRCCRSCFRYSRRRITRSARWNRIARSRRPAPITRARRRTGRDPASST